MGRFLSSNVRDFGVVEGTLKSRCRYAWFCFFDFAFFRMLHDKQAVAGRTFVCACVGVV
jgi:hypothetical protein